MKSAEVFYPIKYARGKKEKDDGKRNDQPFHYKIAFSTAIILLEQVAIVRRIISEICPLFGPAVLVKLACLLVWVRVLVHLVRMCQTTPCFALTVGSGAKRWGRRWPVGLHNKWGVVSNRWVMMVVSFLFLVTWQVLSNIVIFPSSLFFYCFFLFVQDLIYGLFIFLSFVNLTSTFLTLFTEIVFFSISLYLTLIELPTFYWLSTSQECQAKRTQ